MNVFLELTSKSSGPKRVRLKSMTVIGRSKRCQLRISSTEVSREHCQIAVTYDGAFLVDLGSSNGTEVDGHRIKPGAPVKLDTGMNVAIGPARFVVHCEERDDADIHAESGDSFVIAREKPLNDTELMNRRAISTKLESDKAPPAGPVRDAMTELSFSVIDDSQDDEFAVWDSTVLEASVSDSGSSIHDDRADKDKHEKPAAKPKKPFSLFSLLKRSSPAEAPPAKPEADGADTSIQKGTRQPDANDDLDNDDTAEDTAATDDAAQTAHDELNDFLRRLS